MTEFAERLSSLIRGGLDHLVLYDEDVAKVVLNADQESQRSMSSAHERTGRMLYYVLRELEPDFASLRTGDLIRTVLRLPGGAVFYYLVEPGIHLYGATADVAQIDTLDASIADRVNDLRTVVRFSPLDFGSYRSSREPQGTGPGPDVPPAAPAPRPAAPTPAGADDSPAAATLRRALDVEGLHYLAYYRSPSAPQTTDIFEHPALRNFFRGPTVDDRRARYQRLGSLLPGVMRRMNESLRAVIRGELVRVVLDVEQGAVYFHALPDSRFLIGVTLDQSRVAVSDDQMSRTARELEELGEVADPYPLL
jgi:hypothetical protein